ncbi:MAG: DUF2959 domain-containing protein [Gammaproteobacteria bacterium]|nr:DUF2959 domain-containing protein [Gammaproteobacteria bacterium]
MLRTLMMFAPMLLRKKRSWLVLAVVGAVYYFSGDKSGLTSTSGFSMPDFSIQQLWAEPRDILVDRVEDARDAQTDTMEEFQSALEKFKAVTQFDGGDLEDKYNTLNTAFERSEDSAQNISKRIDKVTAAANDLLEEWKDELGQYHDSKLRARAEAQFDDTRRRADQLIAAMRKAESRTKPVLDAFRDQVLYIKHNLNMQAIAALNEEAATIENDVSTLIAEMEASIAEANAFINTLLKT